MHVDFAFPKCDPLTVNILSNLGRLRRRRRVEEDRHDEARRFADEGIRADYRCKLFRRADHDSDPCAHMLGDCRLELGLQRRLALLASEQEIAAGDIGPGLLESEPGCDVPQILHLQLTLAEIHSAKQCDIGRHAASSRREACARASSVTDAPDSIRAISSRRSSALSLRTWVRVPSGPWLFSIR